MIEAGYDDYTVMAISGHSSTLMLARNTHPTEQRKAQALNWSPMATKWPHEAGRRDSEGSIPTTQRL